VTRPQRFGSESSVDEKVELVLRLLRGETLAELSRETGRPRKQLSAWRRRFLVGGETALAGGREQPDPEALRDAQAKLTARLRVRETESRLLARRVALLGDRSRRGNTHLYCSAPYAHALEEPGTESLYVAAWDTHVLVRNGEVGVRQAQGVRPYLSLDPGADPQAGLEELREAGIASFSAITDPMWSPEAAPLQRAFDICHPFTEHHLIDCEGESQMRKRHRNRINQARRVCEVREVSLADHLDRWLELYGGNVEKRQIPQPYTDAYFERLASIEGLRTLAVFAGGEIVAMNLWVTHQDTLYFHEGASSVIGRELYAAYAAYAHAIETAVDCRFVLLGPRGGLRDDPSDGVAAFKRGFANGAVVSYLCSVSLTNPG
jgi:hypothetical protein